MDFKHLGKVQGMLAALLLLGFFGCIAALLFAPAPAVEMRDTLLVLTGALGAQFTAVVQFYFGSSSGSARKDSLLANSMPVGGVDK